MSSMDLKLAWCAALLTRISMPPHSFTHRSMMVRQRSAELMSPATSTALRPASVFDQAPRFLGVLVFLQISNQHVRALAREGDGDRPSNAAIGAGDHGLQ